MRKVLQTLGLVIAFSVLSVGTALAQTADNALTKATPEFTALKDMALDMIPLALAVIAVGVGFALVIRWFKRARSASGASNTASQVFDQGPAVTYTGPSGVTPASFSIADPRLNVNTNTAFLDFDRAVDACTTNTSHTLETIEARWRGLDSTGAPVSGWTWTQYAQWGSGSWDCGDFDVNKRSHQNGALARFPNSAAGVELQFRGLTSGTIYATAKTTGSAVPVAPTNLTGVTIANGVDLSWTPNQTSYPTQIQRKRRSTSGETSWAQIGQLTGSSWVDSTTKEGRRYCYRVRNVNNGNNSAWSNTFCIYTNVLVPDGDRGQLLTCRQVAALVVRAQFTPTTGPQMISTIYSESSFLTHAVSWTGCCFGLSQINLEVWEVTKEAMFIPQQNVDQAKEVYDEQGFAAWDGHGTSREIAYRDDAQQCWDAEYPYGGGSADSIDDNPRLDQDPSVDEGHDVTPDPETDVSCGWNMFCWIKAALKWAFVPPDLEGAWEDFLTVTEDHIPVSLVVGVSTWLTGAGDQLDSVGTGAGGYAGTADVGCVPESGGGPVVDRFDGMCLSGPVQSITGSSAWDPIRSLMTFGLWAAFMWHCIQLARRAVSKSPAVDPEQEGAVA
ncbi:MAG: hypothetical protein LC808_23900 [Actinobacteria bacterium]|nr:hypothetical protein [Actinomycetota bacterium]